MGQRNIKNETVLLFCIYVAALNCSLATQKFNFGTLYMHMNMWGCRILDLTSITLYRFWGKPGEHVFMYKLIKINISINMYIKVILYNSHNSAMDIIKTMQCWCINGWHPVWLLLYFYRFPHLSLL